MVHHLFTPHSWAVLAASKARASPSMRAGTPSSRITESYDGFPVSPGAFQTAGSFDAFVTKLNPQGSGLVYSTYLGGTGGVDRAWGIAIDSLGNATITGDTTANAQNTNNFPVVDAAQTNYGGGLSDAFVSKLNPAGTALVYSTYLGGSLYDEGRDRR